MPTDPRSPAPLSLKPDLEEAARRWEAFYAGDIIDRPVVCVTAPRTGGAYVGGDSYRDRVFGDMDAIVDRAVANAEATYWAGEAIPSLWLSFGPDEIAAFCGAELGWSDHSDGTNWSKPCIADWATDLPIALDAGNTLWRRMLALYRRAADRAAGKALLGSLDLHSNMDLLAAMRGPQQLCMDLIECPEMIDRAMHDARQVFGHLWHAISDAGQMAERGYSAGCYSMEGAAVLQCDFSCMMSPAMFRRWVLPALEEEAEIVKHAIYHWDGPGAQVHAADLIASKGLHTLSYVPGDGHGNHMDHLDLLKRVQAGGKGVQVWGSPDEIKALHRELRPEKTQYSTGVGSEDEAEKLLEWFVRNT